MTDWKRLADILYPEVTMTPEDLEAKYPERQLPEGAKVTRLAPSPTGFMHFGTLFPALIDERLAHQSGGVFFLRIEDTDSKREVEGAERDLIDSLGYYGISFDGGAVLSGDKGDYGPYRQSDRAEIYHVYAKKLVSEGKAYPFFASDEDMKKLAETDKKDEIKNKDWHIDISAQKAEQEKRRMIDIDEVQKNIADGRAFVLYLLADGDGEKKVACTDLVRGKVEFTENDEDFVFLKSDGIPTYHFAHAVDDHLMRVTHVVRGEEWLPSLAKHLQLFRYLGFKTPKYLHISQLMKMDGESKKKLSKRDKGAALSDYKKLGYPILAVVEYVMTLLNSNYEDWRRMNQDADWTDFPFSIKKMSVSGALFDFDKLNDVSKNVISRMSADKVYDDIMKWAGEYDTELSEMLARHPDTAKKAFAIGRGGKKPRKDMTTWADAKNYIGFIFDELFTVGEEYPEDTDMDDVKAALTAFIGEYNEADEQSVWFDKIKAIGESHGYCADMKAYKAEPEKYKGSVADVSMFLRLAVTGRLNSPDMFEVMKILGKERVTARLSAMITKIEG